MPSLASKHSIAKGSIPSSRKDLMSKPPVLLDILASLVLNNEVWANVGILASSASNI